MNTTGVPPAETLAGQTMATLRAFFDQQDHHPSNEHWEALRDIAETLEDMADRAAEPNVFLSSCDPGLGKSQTVAHFARALTNARRYPDVGMIVAVARLTEAEALGKALLALDVPQTNFAIYTSDDSLNVIGRRERDAAQVLITTQQRIEIDCAKGRLFAEATDLFYRSAPRIIRAWDEALLPGVTITLDRNTIYGLAAPIVGLSPSMAERLTMFADSLIPLDDGAHVEMPDWEAEYGVSLRDITDAFAEHRPAELSAARAMMEMGGRRVSAVRAQNKTYTTMLTYRNTLPPDLAPLVVLDASVRVRDVYQIMGEHRGGYEHLTSATKDYSPLKVRVWQTSASKSGFGAEGGHDRLVSGVVRMILTKPVEKWLVVIHKPSKKVGDVAASIARELPPNIVPNVSTLPWGQHMACNLYADVPNVILAGTLFKPHSHHVALTYLAQDRDVRRGLPEAADVTRIERGEHADVILQALCRGRVRKSDGARCLPMDAWIIGAARHGIPAACRAIFPGCDVRSWRPTGRVLQGKLAEAMGIVEAAMAPDGPGWITYAFVRATMKPPMDKTNFRRNVLEHPDWQDEIADRPYAEAQFGAGRRSKGLRRADEEDKAAA